MGNASGKEGGSVVGGLEGGGAELRQPGKPTVRLATDRKSYRKKREKQKKEEQLGFDENGETPTGVSDDVLLTWAPCTRHDKGYEIEMWDLGLQEWVRVAATDDHKPECILSNILSGILYRFRVTAITKEGNVSFPSDPSDSFVLDMPGVQIAPYWIQTPPTIVSLTMDQTLILQAKALGTPSPNFHWYKDHQEELFIGEHVSLETSDELSQLTITNMQPSDGGVYTCTAVNTVGKCVWETVVDLKAKPAFTLPPSLKKLIKFQEDEIIRVKLPLIGVPEPSLKLERLDENGKSIWTMASESDENDKEEPKLQLMENFVVLRIDSAQIRHSGRWCVTATNPIGSDIAVLEFSIKSRPNPPSQPPSIDESTANTVTLSWEAVGPPTKKTSIEENNLEANDVKGPPAKLKKKKIKKQLTEEPEIRYQVEYNREKWDIWLKGRVTSDLKCTIGDLVPGSYYRFRVRTVTDDGVSEPGPQSEPVFLGAPVEDEVFGLPGGNYPKESMNRNGFGRGRVHTFSNSKPSRRQRSWDHLDSSLSTNVETNNLPLTSPNEEFDEEEDKPTADANKSFQAQPNLPSPSMPNKVKPSGHRQASLDREVYYVDGKREENVSYTTPLDAFGTKLGTNARKRGLSEAEEEVYRSSLGSLCAQIMRSSQQSLNKNQQVIKDSTDSSNQVNTQRAPSRSRKDSTPDIEKVFGRLAEQKGIGEKASVMERYDVNKQDKRKLENSLTELCHRLKTISQQNLASNVPGTASVSQPVSDITTLNKSTNSPMRLNDEIEKKDSESLDDKTAPVLTKSSINPLRKYAPDHIDANFKNSSSTSTDHEPQRGRDRTKLLLTSKKFDNHINDSYSFSSSKYRSISCEDARQALNESLMKVSTMQNMLETRRSHSVARLNWSADKMITDKLDLDEEEAKEKSTGDTFNPKKEPSVSLTTTPKGKKRTIPQSPKNNSRGSPSATRGILHINKTNENLSSGSSPSETPLCSSPTLQNTYSISTNVSKTLTAGMAQQESKSPSRSRPKLGAIKGQTSTSFDNTFDSSRTIEGNDTFDYATDNYLSDISCDVTE